MDGRKPLGVRQCRSRYRETWYMEYIWSGTGCAGQRRATSVHRTVLLSAHVARHHNECCRPRRATPPPPPPPPPPQNVSPPALSLDTRGRPSGHQAHATAECACLGSRRRAATLPLGTSQRKMVPSADPAAACCSLGLRQGGPGEEGGGSEQGEVTMQMSSNTRPWRSLLQSAGGWVGPPDPAAAPEAGRRPGAAHGERRGRQRVPHLRDIRLCLCCYHRSGCACVVITPSFVNALEGERSRTAAPASQHRRACMRQPQWLLASRRRAFTQTT